MNNVSVTTWWARAIRFQERHIERERESMHYAVRLPRPTFQSAFADGESGRILPTVRSTDVLYSVHGWRSHLLLYRVHLQKKS